MLSNKYKINGNITLPGDKSIAHRVLILLSMIKGNHIIKNVPQNKDIDTTLSILNQFGLLYQNCGNDRLSINSNNMEFKDLTINCNDSGTTARLMCGLIAGLNINCKIYGSKSLSKRPMSRIIDPLTDFGVTIKSNKGLLPIEIKKNNTKKIGFDYNLKIASAQVKSALMLYALNINKDCTIKGKIHTRDHLENLLKFSKYPISIEKNTIRLNKGKLVESNWSIGIPGDISSASFLIAATVLLKKSDLIIKQIGINKYRMGFINKLIEMGANIDVDSYLNPQGEEEGTIYVKHSKSLKGITVNPEEVPSMIDEIPIFCVVAAFAKTKTIIKGVNELKFKESDRIKSIIENFKSMGGLIDINNDNLVITPTNNLYNTNIKSFSDHRIFMSFYIANLALGTFYSDTLSEQCYDKSFKNFIDIMKEIVHENV